MITLITGVPGAGKSIKTLEIVIKALDEGRAVYTNLPGFNDPRSKVSPDDWRDTPHGSLVVYDEAQQIFPSSAKKGVSEDERVRAMETHRHTGHDLIFVTQDPALLHLNVRKLVGQHMHLHRAMGLKRATVYTWDFAVSSPNSRQEQRRADVANWFHPKKLYGKIQSATIHTHKFQLPFWPTVLLVGGVLLCGVVLWSIFGRQASFAMLKGGTPGQSLNPASLTAAQLAPSEQAPTGVRSVTANDWRAADVLPATRGCAVLTKSCRCWDGEGHQLDLDLAQCLNMANRPLPIDFSSLLVSQPAPVQTPGPVIVKTEVAESPSLVGARGDPRQVGPPGSPMSNVGASVGAMPPR